MSKTYTIRRLPFELICAIDQIACEERRSRTQQTITLLWEAIEARKENIDDVQPIREMAGDHERP